MTDPSKGSLGRTSNEIVVKDLIKVYKSGKTEVIALRGLDCTVRNNEILAIMGPSGCGKTTLLSILGGLDKPTAGSITVDGTNIADFSDAQLVEYRRKKVGIVFQFFNLVSTLTARENVELPMLLDDVSPSAATKTADALLEVVGMSSRRDSKPDDLSGGEQQRVALAVALANDPPILLADEPTGELDTATGLQVLLLLKRLRDEYHKTVVIVTHDQRICRVADRLMTIIDGRITSEVAGHDHVSSLP